jgi:predicted TPR repeat methyltransferase
VTFKEPIHPTSKSRIDIEKEWDAIAPIRDTQISQGKDISFLKILMPAIEQLTISSDLSNVLDVGCGVGFVTEAFSANANSIVGVDLSKRSIEIAQQRLNNIPHAHLFYGSIEEFAQQATPYSFSLAVANMTLMTALDLLSLLKSVARLLHSGGHFVFTITHPCFWSHYWGYDTAEWFHYNQEIVVEAPFKISFDVADVVTTHVHRPLSQYINNLTDVGFSIETIIEPFPPSDTEPAYLQNWTQPRFLAIRCIRK